jgi:lipoate-protein ligase A
LSWRIEEEWEKVPVLHAGSVAALSPDGDQGVQRAVRILNPTDRAVVLGSAEPESHIDLNATRAAGLQVVRRRSGGGAVLVEPGRMLWVDIIIPGDDLFWESDIGRAFWWLGEAWADALAAAGVTDAVVWRGALARTRWSDRVCFAGVGAGEVVVGDQKVVGISQRRTRAGALFQCAVPVVWEPARLVAVLALSDEERAAAEAELSAVAVGLGDRVAGGLVPALLDRLT